eukprot:TRINITY_DN5634_c0_g1_i1.p1 TRINITY_DN5634_c0_g1~~TRINITY_DN5634_c0_g1_i1.p1  ORF type:complete len:787 (+),score=272.29 TRINITY_DN5634_c0_g1_i1:168-2528(+)
MAVRLDGTYVQPLSPDSREKCISIAVWDAQDEYQLSFDEGEVITILDKFAGNPVYDGWYQGKIDGFIGLFPHSYTEPHQRKKLRIDPAKPSSLVQRMQKQLGWVDDGETEKLSAEFEELQRALQGHPEPEPEPQPQAVPEPVAETATASAPAPVEPKAEAEVVPAASEKDEAVAAAAEVVAIADREEKSDTGDVPLSAMDDLFGDESSDASPVTASTTEGANSSEPEAAAPAIEISPSSPLIIPMKAHSTSAAADSKAVEALQSELQALQDALKAQQEANEKLKEEAEVSKGEATSTAEKLESLNSEFSSTKSLLETQVEELTASLSSSKSSLSETEKALQEKTLAEEALQERVVYLKQRRVERESDLKEAIEHAKSALEQTTDERVTALEERLEAANAADKEREKGLRIKLKATVAQLKEQAQEYAAYQQSSTEEKNALAQRVELLEVEVSTSKVFFKKSESLKEEVVNLKEELTNLQATNDQFEEDVITLRDTYEDTIQTLKHRYQKLKEKHGIDTHRSNPPSPKKHHRSHSRTELKEKEEKEKGDVDEGEEKEDRPGQSEVEKLKEELAKTKSELDRTKRNLGQTNAVIDYARKMQEEQENKLRQLQAQMAAKGKGGIFSSKKKEKGGHYGSKPPPPPKTSHRVKELEEELGEYKKVVEKFTADKQTLVSMNRQLIVQLKEALTGGKLQVARPPTAIRPAPVAPKAAPPPPAPKAVPSLPSPHSRSLSQGGERHSLGSGQSQGAHAHFKEEKEKDKKKKHGRVRSMSVGSKKDKKLNRKSVKF